MTLFCGQDLTCIRGERVVFEGLDFTVDAGSVLFLTGPNGSGKTSLIRLMAGLSRPAAGTLTWDGAEIGEDLDGHRTRLRFLGHDDAVKPAITVGDDLIFWTCWRGGGDAAAREAAQRLAIDHLWETPCRFLSAGQRRRLAIARLLATPATLWLLDEPAVGLDRDSRSILETELAHHCADGGCAVVATHQDLSAPRAAVFDFTSHPGER